MEIMELKCIVCASPVEVKVCDLEYIKTNPAAEEWDYWIHCSNEECENQIGEGHFQHYPDWVYTETRWLSKRTCKEMS